MPGDESRITAAGYAVTTEDPDGGWRREVRGKLLVLEQATPNEWWLTLVSAADAPRMSFAGSLGACLAVSRAVVGLLRKGGLR